MFPGSQLAIQGFKLFRDDQRATGEVLFFNTNEKLNCQCLENRPQNKVNPN